MLNRLSTFVLTAFIVLCCGCEKASQSSSSNTGSALRQANDSHADREVDAVLADRGVDEVLSEWLDSRGLSEGVCHVSSGFLILGKGVACRESGRKEDDRTMQHFAIMDALADVTKTITETTNAFDRAVADSPQSNELTHEQASFKFGEFVLQAMTATLEDGCFCRRLTLTSGEKMVGRMVYEESPDEINISHEVDQNLVWENIVSAFAKEGFKHKKLKETRTRRNDGDEFGVVIAVGML